MTAIAAAKPVRRFVPQEINLADFEALGPLYRSLLERRIGSKDELERWLGDFSELIAAVDEYSVRRYIEKSCHTDDAEIEKRYMHFVENVEPKIKPLYFELQKKLLESPYASLLEERRFAVLLRRWRSDVEIFRPENVPLETAVIKLVNDYDKISGAMTVEFDGKEQTLPQMARYQEQTDRGRRQSAWEAVIQRRLKERGPIDGIFDQLLELRGQIAMNAGLSDYRAYAWKAQQRFDYTPEQCLEFADAIAEVCMPLVKQLDEQRKRRLGLEKLRPWDAAVDPAGRMALSPFGDGQTGDFVRKTRQIFERLSPELAAEFDTLSAHGNLDLESRKNKQPGGYQSQLEESRQPFIFMNAAGLQRDVETLLHEGGHAFHFLAAADEPLVFLRSAPMEFCEVASMSMELLGSEHFDIFYNPADTIRAQRTMIEGIVRFFPWMATIDSFQHWLYTHPGHTSSQRTHAWIQIVNRFSGNVDWSGYENAKEAMWQRQLHLFHVPFYYIEYGIAQLGALQLWLKAKENPRGALANYRAALKLGGKRPLPELFAAAGIQFDFSVRTLGPLIKALEDELEQLPD